MQLKTDSNYYFQIRKDSCKLVIPKNATIEYFQTNAMVRSSKDRI